MDFLLLLIELLFARCYGRGVTSEYWFKIGDSLQRGPVEPKFQVECVAPTNLFSSQKTRLNEFSYGIKIWTDLFPFCYNSRV